MMKFNRVLAVVAACVHVQQFTSYRRNGKNRQAENITVIAAGDSNKI